MCTDTFPIILDYSEWTHWQRTMNSHMRRKTVQSELPISSLRISHLCGCLCVCVRRWGVKTFLSLCMHACTRTWRWQAVLSKLHKVSPWYHSHPIPLHAWLHLQLHWGLLRFIAHNCLPLHRRHFSKYDRLILMCLPKHNTNTNAALHAWANRCRCHLIISHACTLSWSVNCGPISSSPLRPSADRRRFDWWWLHGNQPPPDPHPRLSVPYFHGSSRCASRKITAVQ